LYQTKQINTMAYVKISNRNLKNKKVTILCKQFGATEKTVREDRVQKYISDFVLFNKLTGKPYMVKISE